MSKRAAESTYRPKGYGISPSLARARAPFRTQNVITGFTLFGFAASVWAYSIYAVKQDNFDDVDFEALNTSVEEKARRISLEDEAKAKKGGGVKSMAHETEGRLSASGSTLLDSTTTVAMSNDRSTVATSADQRGLLHRLPGVSKLYNPGEMSLVSRAPPVDQLGRMGDRLEDWRQV